MNLFLKFEKSNDKLYGKPFKLLKWHMGHKQVHKVNFICINNLIFICKPSLKTREQKSCAGSGEVYFFSYHFPSNGKNYCLSLFTPLLTGIFVPFLFSSQIDETISRWTVPQILILSPGSAVLKGRQVCPNKAPLILCLNPILENRDWHFESLDPIHEKGFGILKVLLPD